MQINRRVGLGALVVIATLLPAAVSAQPPVLLHQAAGPGSALAPEPLAPPPPAPTPLPTPVPSMAPELVPTLANPPAPPPEPRPLPVLSRIEAEAAVSELRMRMRMALGAAMTKPSPAVTERATALARAMLARIDRRIERPQLLLVVDRAGNVQRLWVMAAMPDEPDWTPVGAVRISSGKPGKAEHFKTPVGVFDNDATILGYRAEGTFNQNHIRGIGLAGMRVWDFGWQTTEDWRKPEARTAVRLEMHATDPTFLEGRLGRPDSEACIRIPARFNSFMDQAGLIDARMLALVPQNRAITALLRKDATPTPLAGELVIVVDSSEPEAKPSDPVEAQMINLRFANWLAAQASKEAAAQATARLAAKAAAKPAGATETAKGDTAPVRTAVVRQVTREEAHVPRPAATPVHVIPADARIPPSDTPAP